MDHISILCPETYAQWEKYFLDNIADESKIYKFAFLFRDYVLRDTAISNSFAYEQLDIQDYEKMVMCRLVYETWLGYFAEITTCELLLKKLNEETCEIRAERLSPEDDNRYAVDYLIYKGSTLLCGIQVKSINYKKSKQNIVKRTIASNKQKNATFTLIYGVPVHYVYYKRENNNKCVLSDADIPINNIKEAMKKVG